MSTAMPHATSIIHSELSRCQQDHKQGRYRNLGDISSYPRPGLLRGTERSFLREGFATEGLVPHPQTVIHVGGKANLFLAGGMTSSVHNTSKPRTLRGDFHSSQRGVHKSFFRQKGNREVSPQAVITRNSDVCRGLLPLGTRSCTVRAPQL